MIILPDRHAPRGKFLIPLRRAEWCVPSQAQRKTRFGHEDRYTFRIRGRLRDGAVKWQGLFEDREDADAFLFALVTGSLRYERELWELPTPHWRPEFIPLDLVYDFATTVLFTNTATTSWTVPGDYSNVAANKAYCIGGGGNGTNGNNGGMGGGGGGYAEQTNISLTVGASITIQVGGVATDTWFNGANLAASSCGAQGGTNAPFNNNGAGGGATSVGSLKNAGGNGGNSTSTGSGGGGGAGGPNGTGGTAASASGTQGTNGGAGDNAMGGAGGSGGSANTNGGNGSPGTEIVSNIGSGGGGGGAGVGPTGSPDGGNAGNYGAAGGGYWSNGGQHQGAQGVIAFTYGTNVNSQSVFCLP